MKKKIIKISAFISLMMILTACPYESVVPVSTATEKIDKNLLGEWISAGELEFDKPTYYIINKFSKVKYELIEKRFSSYDSVYKETKYFMHSSTLKNRIFMNIQPIEGGKYNLHAVEIAKNELTVFEVTEHIDEQFSSSTDLKSFVEENMHLSFFYEKDEKKFIRKSN
jgi:hypothetical protein